MASQRGFFWRGRVNSPNSRSPIGFPFGNEEYLVFATKILLIFGLLSGFSVGFMVGIFTGLVEWIFRIPVYHQVPQK